MLFVYYPIIVFENFARMAVTAMQVMQTSMAAPKPKAAEPTIILME